MATPIYQKLKVQNEELMAPAEQALKEEVTAVATKAATKLELCEETNHDHIKKRIVLARQWREQLPEHQRLAEKYCYIRIGGNQFRPISISLKNPCGRLIKNDGQTPLAGAKSIYKAIQSADDAMPADHYRPANGKEKAKPEHRIQAFIIRHALKNHQVFHDLFDDFRDVFDELIFITDELSAGQIRADIVALGRKKDVYFPVFIELKVSRALTRLLEQLEHAKKAMEIVKDDFMELLSAASTIPKEKISFDASQSMLIWTATPSGKESKEVIKARSKGVITAAFAENDGGAYSFRKLTNEECK